MAHPVPPYGVAIQDAIASGEIDKMRQVAHDAELYLQEFGEIGEGLRKLRSEIERLAGGSHGGAVQPLYGVVIRGAIQSGDPARMQDVALQAQALLSQADEMRDALAELQNAIAVANRPIGRVGSDD